MDRKLTKPIETNTPLLLRTVSSSLHPSSACLTARQSVLSLSDCLSECLFGYCLRVLSACSAIICMSVCLFCHCLPVCPAIICMSACSAIVFLYVCLSCHCLSILPSCECLFCHCFPVCLSACSCQHYLPTDNTTTTTTTFHPLLSRPSAYLSFISLSSAFQISES